MKNIMKSIKLFRGLNQTVRPAAPVPVKVTHDVTLADKFELFDSKGEPTPLDLKKLTGNELYALISYLEGYIEDHRAGKFMFKGKGRCPMAAFDEAGIHAKMIPMLGAFKKELAKKQGGRV
jgi:hypothetical protein